MNELPKGRTGTERRGPMLSLVSDRSDATMVPAGHQGLRRAAEMVEDAAYGLAGKESADFVSRLIEIAAELDRAACLRRRADLAEVIAVGVAD